MKAPGSSPKWARQLRLAAIHPLTEWPLERTIGCVNLFDEGMALKVDRPQLNKDTFAQILGRF